MRQGKMGIAALSVVAGLVAGYFAGLLFPIEFSTISGAQAIDDPCVKWKGSAVALKGPFKKEGSYAFVTDLPEFKELGDSLEQKERSQLVLCEDGHAIGTPHSVHDDVRN